MTVYAYTRVSTTRQAEEGESLGTQERVVAGYAMQHELTVDRTYTERGVSGSVPLCDRPQGAALLAAIKPGDTIITPKLDRMFRSALDALGVLGDLKQHGIALHMIDLGGDVTTDGASKLVFTILSAVAEAERDRVRERIAGVKADQKARGHYRGGKIPYGYRVVGTDKARRLEPIPEQQETIATILTLRGEGKPLRAIQAAISERLALETIARVCRDAP